MQIHCPTCKQEYDVDDKYVNQSLACPNCNTIFTPEISAPSSIQKATKECPMCGETVLAVAKKCRHCGEFFNDNDNNNNKENRVIYVLLALFFGGFGFHNFYYGDIFSGLLKIVFSIIAFGLAATQENVAHIISAICFILLTIWILKDIFTTKKPVTHN